MRLSLSSGDQYRPDVLELVYGRDLAIASCGGDRDVSELVMAVASRLAVIIRRPVLSILTMVVYMSSEGY